MDTAALLASAQRHFASPGEPRAASQRHFASQGEPQAAAGLTLLQRNGQPIGLALLTHQPDGLAYLRAFEDGMQAVLAARQQQPSWQLALVVDMQPAFEPQAASYRAALKKYSNSVVFEDVGIGLLLLGRPQPVWLPPAEVSAFLRQLDRWLLAAR
ncbi:MAG: hypothetical protein KF701_04900 [Anaerolineales bacterium]|nr:MAG: hypothetical protein KF701_04900 [Anaerolineales bacterium]